MDTHESYPTLAYANPVPPRADGGAVDRELAARVTEAVSELQVAVAEAQAAGLRVDLGFERVRGRLPELDTNAETLVGKLDIYRDLG
jgi:hypothetical protein